VTLRRVVPQAWFHNAWFHNAWFHNAWFHIAWLHKAWLHSAWFHNASRHNAWLYNAWLLNAWFHTAWFYNAWLHNASRRHASPRGRVLISFSIHFAIDGLFGSTSRASSSDASASFSRPRMRKICTRSSTMAWKSAKSVIC